MLNSFIISKKNIVLKENKIMDVNEKYFNNITSREPRAIFEGAITMGHYFTIYRYNSISKSTTPSLEQAIKTIIRITT